MKTDGRGETEIENRAERIYDGRHGSRKKETRLEGKP